MREVRKKKGWAQNLSSHPRMFVFIRHGWPEKQEIFQASILLFCSDGAPKKYSSSCSSVLVVRICLLICFFSLRYTFSFVFVFVSTVSFLFLRFLLQLHTHLLEEECIKLEEKRLFSLHIFEQLYGVPYILVMVFSYHK